MYLDSCIAERVHHHFTTQAVPVLSVHDSYIIDYTRFLAMKFARRRHQKMADLFKNTVIAPAVEIVAHSGHRREIIGQHPPRTAGAGDVQNGIQNISHCGLARTTRSFGWRNEWRNQLSFLIG